MGMYDYDKSPSFSAKPHATLIDGMDRFKGTSTIYLGLFKVMGVPQ
jgi:hypothetical protein